jgi:hypothetical protein
MKQNETFETHLVPKSSEHLKCICGTLFNNRTALWRHKKTCKSENNDSVDKSLNDKELIILLVKQNNY